MQSSSSRLWWEAQAVKGLSEFQNGKSYISEDDTLHMQKHNIWVIMTCFRHISAAVFVMQQPTKEDTCVFVCWFVYFYFLGAGPGWFPVAGCFLLIQSLHCVNGAETADRFDSISLYTTLEQPKRKFPVFSLSSSVLLRHFREKLVFHRFFKC